LKRGVHRALELRCAAAVSVCQETQERILRKQLLSPVVTGFVERQERHALTQTIYVSVVVLTAHGSVGKDETVKVLLLVTSALKVVAEVSLSVPLELLHIVAS
jgi:hypothetical protein